MTAFAIVKEIIDLSEDECLLSNLDRQFVVITGGEPFRQNITIVCDLLLSKGFDIQVETNGTYPPRELHPKVQIVVSPKTGKINAELEQRITALKYVVKAGCIDRADGLPIRSLDHTCSPTVAKPPEGYTGPIYLQPMDDGTIRGQRENATAAVNACKKYGHKLQLQTHKVLGIE